jgi:hypothetical protein
MTFDNWAVVWSDNAEIEKIANATAGQLAKLRERISAGEFALKLPLLEYSTGHAESKLPLDFEREATLINSLEPLSGTKFLEKIHDRRPFRPFVAMLEGNFLVIYNASEYFRCRWNYLKQSRLVSEESSHEIDSLLRLADWEIENYFEKGKPTGKETRETFDMDLIREAEKKNPEANQLVMKHVMKEKPVITVPYNGNNYLAIGFEKTDRTPGIQDPTILFPEASRESIPNAGSFYGRVCGIVNFMANPPPLYSNVILQSVILALPMNY